MDNISLISCIVKMLKLCLHFPSLCFSVFVDNVFFSLSDNCRTDVRTFIVFVERHIDYFHVYLNEFVPRIKILKLCLHLLFSLFTFMFLRLFEYCFIYSLLCLSSNCSSCFSFLNATC